MAYLYEACDQISDSCHQQLLRKMQRKISWTDGRTEVKQYTLLSLRGAGVKLCVFSINMQWNSEVISLNKAIYHRATFSLQNNDLKQTPLDIFLLHNHIQGLGQKKIYVCLRPPDPPYFSTADPNLFYRQLFHPNFC